MKEREIYADWFAKIMQIPLETKEQFENRVNAYIWDSVPEYGELWTAKGLDNKVERDGKLKPFYGNTIVFPLEEEVTSYVEEIQSQLYQSCGNMFAELLNKETFHITLHDLVNGPEISGIANAMQVKGFAAFSILEQLKKLDLPVIHMESTCVFNMASTSIVLGMKPADEESCKRLMMLYDLFQVIVPLNYGLTPHITLAYYKPGIYNAEILRTLREVLQQLRSKTKLILELDVKKLVYQEFDNMNHYKTL